MNEQNQQFRPVTEADLKAAFARRHKTQTGVKQVMPYVFLKTTVVKKPRRKS